MNVNDDGPAVPIGAQTDDNDISDSSYVPEALPKRKRKRQDSAADMSAKESEGVKKLRRCSSEFGKEFACQEDGCVKRFKTVRVHFYRRPFSLAHLTDIQCR